MHKKSLWGGLILFGFAMALFGQRVERVAGLYILLSSDRIGKVGDTVVIERDTPDGIREVGVVRIVKLQDGKTAARIEKDTPLKIEKGDRVRIPGTGEVKEDRKAVEKTLTRHGVIRVIQGYALLDSSAGLSVGDELDVQRATSGDRRPIGKVRVIKITQGLAAAKILNQSPSSKIQRGDEAVSIGSGTPDLSVSLIDIDYYFYGAYRSE